MVNVMLVGVVSGSYKDGNTWYRAEWCITTTSFSNQTLHGYRVVESSIDSSAFNCYSEFLRKSGFKPVAGTAFVSPSYNKSGTPITLVNGFTPV